MAPPSSPAWLESNQQLMNITGLPVDSDEVEVCDSFAMEDVVVELEGGERKSSTAVPETRASALSMSIPLKN